MTVTLTPNARRDSFNSIIVFLPYNLTTELYAIPNTCNKVLSELLDLITLQKVVISLVAAVARNFMHDRHLDLYLR